MPYRWCGWYQQPCAVFLRNRFYKELCKILSFSKNKSFLRRSVGLRKQPPAGCGSPSHPLAEGGAHLLIVGVPEKAFGKRGLCWSLTQTTAGLSGADQLCVRGTLTHSLPLPLTLQSGGEGCLPGKVGVRVKTRRPVPVPEVLKPDCT